jgi:predicted DNA-binding antitoxin AbrB/MazE fold protein
MGMSIRAVYERGQLRLLDPVDLEDGAEVNVTITRAEESHPQASSRLSARDLLKMPVEERSRIMALAAARAEECYQNDSALTDFEAYSEHDLYDETP